MNKADECLINPEDEFKLTIKDGETEIAEDAYKQALHYQSISYYIMDSDQRLTEITDHIYKNAKFTDYVNGDKKEIDWNIPGWFAAQLHVFNPSDFKLIFTLDNMPQYTSAEATSELKFSLKFRLYTDAALYAPEKTSEDTYKVIYKITRDDMPDAAPIYGVLDSETPFTDMLNGTRYYNSNSTGTQSFTEVKKGTQFTITAYPCYKNVVYDNLKLEYKYIADNVVFNKSLTIGNQTWQYFATRGEDSDYPESLNLIFNVSGFQDELRPTLEYRLERALLATGTDGNKQLTWQSVNPINSNFEETGKDQYEWYIYDNDVNKDVDCQLALSLQDYNEIDNFTEGDEKLVAEAIYRISFRIKVEDQYSSVVQKTFISSELFSGFTINNFDNLKPAEWLSNYSKCIRNAQAAVTYTVSDEVTCDDPDWFTFLNKNKELDTTHPYAINRTDWKKLLNGATEVTAYAEQKATGTITSGLDKYLVPHGPIWDDYLSGTTVTLSVNYKGEDSTFTKLEINPKTGKLIIPSTISFDTAATYATPYKVQTTYEFSNYLPYKLLDADINRSTTELYTYYTCERSGESWNCSAFDENFIGKLISGGNGAGNIILHTVFDSTSTLSAICKYKASVSDFAVIPLEVKMRVNTYNHISRTTGYLNYGSEENILEYDSHKRGSKTRYTYWLYVVSSNQNSGMFIKTPYLSELTFENDAIDEGSVKTARTAIENFCREFKSHFKKYIRNDKFSVYNADYINLIKSESVLSKEYLLNTELKFEGKSDSILKKYIPSLDIENVSIKNSVLSESNEVFEIPDDQINRSVLAQTFTIFNEKVDEYKDNASLDRVNFSGDKYKGGDGVLKLVYTDRVGADIENLTKWVNGDSTEYKSFYTVFWCSNKSNEYAQTQYLGKYFPNEISENSWN